MNQSTPILICDENEDLRLLIKEMLIKNGFFYLLEAHSREEIIQLFNPNHFLLIHNSMIDSSIDELIKKTNKFLIVAQNDKEESVKLAASYGVKHLISFPYSSHSLVERINSLNLY